MKITTREYKIIAFFAAVILFIVLFFTQCNYNTTEANVETTEIVVPGFDSRFDPIQPFPLPEKKQVEKTVEYKGKKIKFTKQFDEKKADVFVEALKDTSNIEKPVQLYVEAVQKNHYKQFFKNADIEMTVNASTTGTLDSLSISDIKVYDRKAVVSYKEKIPVFSAFLGAEIYSSTTNIKPGFKLNLGLQRKDGDIITGGYSTDNTVYIGYYKRLFQIKK